MVKDSVEEMLYKAVIEREKSAFLALIKEKGTPLLPLLHIDASLGHSRS